MEINSWSKVWLGVRKGIRPLKTVSLILKGTVLKQVGEENFEDSRYTWKSSLKWSYVTWIIGLIYA